MSKRPYSLILLSFFLICIAIGFPLQIMFIYGHSISELGTIYDKLTWLNLLCMFFCLLNAYFLFEGMKIVHWTIPISLVIVTFNNFTVSRIGVDFTHSQTMVASLSFLMLYSLLFEPKAKAVLTGSLKKWWKNPPRYKLHLPISILPHCGIPFDSKTHDLSYGGFFIPYDQSENSQKLLPGKKISIKLALDQLTNIRCEGHVVRVALAAGTYPSGMGVKFDNMNFSDRRLLKKYLSK